MYLPYLQQIMWAFLSVQCQRYKHVRLVIEQAGQWLLRTLKAVNTLQLRTSMIMLEITCPNLIRLECVALDDTFVG